MMEYALPPRSQERSVPVVLDGGFESAKALAHHDAVTGYSSLGTLYQEPFFF